jgi:hypothetical protein
MKKIIVFVCACLGLSLGGCATFEIEPASHARLASGKYVHMPLVSPDEDRLLREATERAMALHSQLRAFDAANKAVENRILQLQAEMQQGATGNRRAIVQSPKTSPKAPHSIESSRFDVRFAKGSVALDKKVIADLSKALGSGNFSQNPKAAEFKQLVVLQVVTHKKQGLDSFNARRLGAIHDEFKKHNVPMAAVKLKIVRVAMHPVIDQKADGNASRTIQLNSVRVGKLEL